MGYHSSIISDPYEWTGPFIWAEICMHNIILWGCSAYALYVPQTAHLLPRPTRHPGPRLDCKCGWQYTIGLLIVEFSPCSIVLFSRTHSASLARRQEQHCLVSRTYHHSGLGSGFATRLLPQAVSHLVLCRHFVLRMLLYIAGTRHFIQRFGITRCIPRSIHNVIAWILWCMHFQSAQEAGSNSRLVFFLHNILA